MDETAYLQGSRAAWLTMLMECLKHLGYEASETEHARWIVERAGIVQTLRTICAEHGDNNWLDSDHLADVLRNNLASYLD